MVSSLFLNDQEDAYARLWFENEYAPQVVYCVMRS